MQGWRGLWAHQGMEWHLVVERRSWRGPEQGDERPTKETRVHAGGRTTVVRPPEPCRPPAAGGIGKGRC